MTTGGKGTVQIKTFNLQKKDMKTIYLLLYNTLATPYLDSRVDPLGFVFLCWALVYKCLRMCVRQNGELEKHCCIGGYHFYQLIRTTVL